MRWLVGCGGMVLLALGFLCLIIGGVLILEVLTHPGCTGHTCELRDLVLTIGLIGLAVGVALSVPGGWLAYRWLKTRAGSS